MITENNKIIAEFLGWGKKIDKKEEETPFYNLPIKFNNLQGLKEYIPCEGFIFDTDWNWLMEVVEKIKKETNKDDFLSRLTTSETRKAIDLETTLENCFRKSYLSIEAVYNACVEFIKWYNEQKKV